MAYNPAERRAATASPASVAEPMSVAPSNTGITTSDPRPGGGGAELYSIGSPPDKRSYAS